MAYKDATLGVDESTDRLILEGNCDVWVSGLSSGAVKLQIMFQNESAWRDVPDASYTADTFKTIFISEDRVKGRLTGDSNNAGVYARLGRNLNT